VSAYTAGDGIDLVPGEPTVADEELQRDEQRVAGEGRERRIGRAAVARGTERENLPEALLACGEEVHKAISGGAEVADASEGWQRGYVKQDTGDALRVHRGFRFES
jgi:hypothetical protein